MGLEVEGESSPRSSPVEVLGELAWLSTCEGMRLGFRARVRVRLELRLRVRA